MDNPNVYGPQAYSLTFAEAARRSIICGYKVIISVITSEAVTNELLRRGEVLVNGDAVHARQVANQIALRDAVEEYHASKAFTFHRTVKSAASFVANGSQGICTHLPEFQTFHVNGHMPTGRREREMRDFRAAPRAVMSNARCLTEGVDVPAVDLVAFLSPRRSRVDIVQATGRAMRRSPGKTTGYVLVPLYVEQAANESVEAAVSRSAFDEVWDVLHSLQEQDDVLAELIRHMGEQKGSTKGFDDSRIADRVDIVGIPIGLEALRSAVKTRCFESLFSSWDTYFGKLRAFNERFGHCNVEAQWGEDGSLGSWVSAQRTRRTKGTLSEQQIARLEDLGFVWKWNKLKAETTWMLWYRELESYWCEHGDSNIPRTHPNTKLASWVWIQRQRRRGTSSKAGDTMTPEQVSLLDKLNFLWDVRDDKWAENIRNLKLFKEQHGHCEVDLIESDGDAFCRWFVNQRSLGAAGNMDATRLAQLNDLGFPWTSGMNDRRWHDMYERLKRYHSTYGNSDVPSRWKDDPKLAAWLTVQRGLRKQGQMSDERVCLLDELNVTWKSRDVGTWEDRLAEVVAFREKHGHCEIPTTYPENQKLGRFVNSMRTTRIAGELSAERIAKLDAVGFPWVSSRRAIVGGTWQIRFDELVRYKEEYGDCNVPNVWPLNTQLGRWVDNQRSSRKAGKLAPERERLLESIGFVWNLRFSA